MSASSLPYVRTLLPEVAFRRDLRYHVPNPNHHRGLSIPVILFQQLPPKIRHGKRKMEYMEIR